MITGAGKMPVVGAALLISVGFTDRAVHVQNQLLHRSLLMQPFIPHSRHLFQGKEIFILRQHLGLESTHLAGRSCLMLASSSSHHITDGGIDRETLGVIGVLISRQTAENRLPKKGHHRVLGVLAGALIGEGVVCHRGQIQHLVEFPVSEQTRVRCHLRSMKFQL
jgi:hypothetical protein